MFSPFTHEHFLGVLVVVVVVAVVDVAFVALISGLIDVALPMVKEHFIGVLMSSLQPFVQRSSW